MLLANACSGVPLSENVDWSVYGAHPSEDRFSWLRQISPTNVHRLREVWRFEMQEDGDSETNPLIIDGVLYGYTPALRVIALDAATGRLLWKFNPKGALAVDPQPTQRYEYAGPSRGLAYWSDGKARRLLAAIGDRLYAIDPRTGQQIDNFGEHGAVDLRRNLRGDGEDNNVFMTSPGIVYKDLLIVGFRTLETHPAPPGDIRAYDVRTGALRWSFHTLPHPGEVGYESWPADAWTYSGAANNWAGFALDIARGIVYAPTGSAVYDFYGADRTGNDLFSDTLLALDAATGKRLWHFQGVHHDLWDRDFSSPPSLLTINRHGHRIDAVVQPTKQGFLFVFNRVTGAPLFPIEEVPAPASEVPGEVSAPTQPRPVAPKPFARQRLTEQLLTERTPAAHDWALHQLRSFRSDGAFVPFGVDRPTVIFPGFDGGAEWGGAAVDPRSSVVYINSNDVAWTGQLAENTEGSGVARALYNNRCALCHGVDRLGVPDSFPSLIDAASRMSAADIASVIRSGRGRMPAFADIPEPLLKRLTEFLLTGTDTTEGSDLRLSGEGRYEPYAFTGYKKFVDPDGYPANAPPWGTLNAIDLNTGHYLWKIPLGEYPELTAQGLGTTGTENYGGPIVTASGLVFIGATVFDKKIRAFDAKNGTLLWEGSLPHAGTATPATYAVHGKQYVVIVTSDRRDSKASRGAAYVAFALP